MSDLLARLRDVDVLDDYARLEAADEIERLHEALVLARNDLRSALREIERELSFSSLKTGHQE